MERLWNDLRFGLRMLAKNPTFTLIAVLSLALGIGANTAIFSIVDTVLLRPLPYADPGRLVMIYETFAHPGGRGQGSVSIPNIEDWRRQNRSFEEIGAFTFGGKFTLSGDAGPELVAGLEVTPEVFPLLGVEPLLGRFVHTGDDELGDRVVVLSYEMWQSRFGGVEDIVGRSLLLNSESYDVIGVMPPEFSFPPRSRRPSSTSRWTPGRWRG